MSSSRRLETWVSSFLVKKGDKRRRHTQRSNDFFFDSLIMPMGGPQTGADRTSAGELAEGFAPPTGEQS
jgi:hypothetical protein